MNETPRLDALLAAQRLAGDYELSDLSPVEINRLSMRDYAKVRERAGLDPIDPFAAAYAAYEPEHQGQEQPPAPVQEHHSAPQGIDLASLTMTEYAALRGSLGVGGREYGRGVLDGSSTADWVQAAQQKAGRSGMQAGNVTEAARVNGRMPIANQPVQGRAGFYR